MKYLTRLYTTSSLLACLAIPSLSMAEGAYLEITLDIEAKNRPAAGSVYSKYKATFLDNIAGAQSKELLIRDEDVQVLHGFETTEQAQAYLKSTIFTQDVVRELGPFLKSDPEIRIYQSH